MATITFSVSSSLVTGSKVYTLTEADLTRMINVYGAKVSANFTPAQALLQWASESMNAAVGSVYSSEAAAASRAISPISVT